MQCPELGDGLVRLDAFTPADVAAHLANEDDEIARRFGWWPKRSTPETVRAAIARWIDAWERNGEVRAFAVRVDGTLVGQAELRLQTDAIAHASYSIGLAARRQGYASRALRLMSLWAFRTLGLARIELYIELDNAASRGVACAAGFAEEGVLRDRLAIAGVRRDAVLYAKLAGYDQPAQ